MTSFVSLLDCCLLDCSRSGSITWLKSPSNGRTYSCPHCSRFHFTCLAPPPPRPSVGRGRAERALGQTVLECPPVWLAALLQESSLLCPLLIRCAAYLPTHFSPHINPDLPQLLIPGSLPCFHPTHLQNIRDFGFLSSFLLISRGKKGDL